MNFSQFFIQRPIFAAVLSLLILIVGSLSLFQLPISEYPEVAPPTVVVRTNFPGANPKVIGETVAAPLEQAIVGVEGMLYMASQATADGSLTLTITFGLGTDLDNAQVQVQNRVTRTMPTLPSEVQRLGVTVDKASPDMTLLVNLISPDQRYDELYLSNYAALNIRDELARLDGVGDVRLRGMGDYSLRVWLDPDKVASRNLTASDVFAAIREQNRQVAAGSLGAPPSDAGNSFQLTINTQGRLVSEEEFENIIVRAGEGGEITRLKDIARIDLGSREYTLRARLDGQPTVAIPVYQRPGSNAIAISDAVRARMAELRQSFPQGLEYEILYDPTIFVRSSIEAVVHTLLEAIVLVVLVVLLVILFLQTWRASIIPLAAVPVSLIGTFAVMHMFGFSINALSMFGLVLAIGIVVDDAIVVVENVERNIGLGKSPVEATRQAMKEVTGPIIATALVLCAVFVPTAFISGLTGQFYQQFALTIAISTVISAFNSLTLSPALAALLLKGHRQPRDRFSRLLDRLLGGWLFGPFNRLLKRANRGYIGTVRRVLRGSSIAMFLYAGLMGLTWLGLSSTPTGFVPAQDKQYLLAKARELPELNPVSVFSSYRVNVPQIDASIDREKAKTHGVAISDIFDTLQVYLGSLYANDINRFGRTYQVNVQADQQFRLEPAQIGKLKVRNNRGEMVPLSTFVTVSDTTGTDRVMHYNGFLTAEINGAAAPGYSSGQAQAAIARLLGEELPGGMTYEWTDLAYQQILAGNTAILVFPLLVFPLCVLLAFLVLAAQYESWGLPLAVILIVPTVLFSAISGVILSGGDNNIFTQIGLIVLVGLACKNAILIVEFAREKQEEGLNRLGAVLEACRLRLRPILMTSIAFIMGVVPLVLSSGAGAEMRQALGVAVFSGMIGVTFFGLLLTPVFYVLVRAFVEKRQARDLAVS